jgi:hypothetical protein
MENLQETARHQDFYQKKQGPNRHGTAKSRPEYRDHHVSHCQGAMQKARRGFPPGLHKSSRCAFSHESRNSQMKFLRLPAAM